MFVSAVALNLFIYSCVKIWTNTAQHSTSIIRNLSQFVALIDDYVHVLAYTYCTYTVMQCTLYIILQSNSIFYTIVQYNEQHYSLLDALVVLNNSVVFYTVLYSPAAADHDSGARSFGSWSQPAKSHSSGVRVYCQFRLRICEPLSFQVCPVEFNSIHHYYCTQYTIYSTVYSTVVSMQYCNILFSIGNCNFWNSRFCYLCNATLYYKQLQSLPVKYFN